MSKSPHCPICGQELDTVQFLLQANEVFSEIGHRVKFGCCGTVFYIEAEGVKWYEALKGRPRTKSGKCGYCERTLEGSKFKMYCNGQCKQMAYYRRQHPTVQREKKILLRSKSKNKDVQ